MTGTNCDLFTHKSSRSYLNHLVFHVILKTNLVRGSQVYEQHSISLCAAVWRKVKPLLKCFIDLLIT